MNETTGKSRFYLPVMEGFYAQVEALGVPLIRFMTGLILMPHGAQKLFGMFGGNPDGTAAFFSKIGLEPAMPLVILVGIVELFGGLCLAIGFLTRPAAAAIFIAMAVAMLHVHLGNGFFWGKGGYEYSMLLAFIGLGFFLKGGGNLSVDAKIGREF